MNNLASKTFSNRSGLWRDFKFRENSNDENTINAVFSEDEYCLKEVLNFKGGIVIDLGGHIGSFSLLASSFNADAHVFTVESCPENYEILMENIKRNNLMKEIQVYHKAIWGKAGEYLRLYYGDDSDFGKIHKFNTSH